MASWNFEQFVKHVEKGDTHPFYLFYGDEIYLSEDALKKIKSKVFEDSLADFNLDNFYGGELDIDDLGSASVLKTAGRSESGASDGRETEVAWTAYSADRRFRVAQKGFIVFVSPVSAGGATEPANGQALCPRCNLEKGAQAS